MRVPGIVFASRSLIPAVASEQALEQVANVATLPGIVVASYAMPDVHWGYGFPIGGVAATDIEREGVVSPGGVGFDISCGVRLLVSRTTEDDLAPVMPALMDALDRAIPRGVGVGGVWALRDEQELGRDPRGRLPIRGGARARRGPGHRALRGSRRGVRRRSGRGERSRAEERAPPGGESRRREPLLGDPGGRHDLRSRGRGGVRPGGRPRVRDDPLGISRSGTPDLHRSRPRHADGDGRYQIQVPDRQLACVPVVSPEGHAYLGAMSAAANYGRANRQMLAEAARDAFARVLEDGQLDLLYDVSHNLAKLERHPVEGQPRLLCVHRKGATRALPPGHPDLPEDLRPIGQPVLIPGSMGTASHVLVGVEGGEAFASTAHGAGRTMSRHAAVRQVGGTRPPRTAGGVGDLRPSSLAAGPRRGGALRVQGRRRGRRDL